MLFEVINVQVQYKSGTPQASSPVRLCNRPLGRHWLLGHEGRDPPTTFRNPRASRTRRLLLEL